MRLLELEEPELAAARSGLETLWQAIDGAGEHGLTARTIATLRRELREAALHQRLGRGPYARWAELASHAEGTRQRLEPLLEDLLLVLDDVADVTAAVAKRRADAGDGGAPRQQSDDGAEEASSASAAGGASSRLGRRMDTGRRP